MLDEQVVSNEGILSKLNLDRNTILHEIGLVYMT